MSCYTQELRRGMLKIVRDDVPQVKANAMNLIETIISLEMDAESIVEAVGNNDLLITYRPADGE